MVGQTRPVMEPGRRHRDAVAVDERIEEVGGRATRGAVEVIEPAVDGRVGNRPRVVDARHRLEAVLVDRAALPVREAQAHVPLAVQRGAIPLRAQHAGQREAGLFDQTGAAGAGEHAGDAGPELHSAGQDAVAAGRAHGRRTVGVGEAHALGRQPIEVRHRYSRLGVVAGHVAVAQIVGENQQNVRSIHRSLPKAARPSARRRDAGPVFGYSLAGSPRHRGCKTRRRRVARDRLYHAEPARKYARRRRTGGRG